MTKKIIAIVLSAFMAISVLTACDDEEDTSSQVSNISSVQTDESKGSETNNSENSGDKWTIMVYLCGTDLESDCGSATENLDEIKKASLTDNITFLIQTGGTTEWKTEGIDSSKLQRFKITNGDMELVDEQPLASMADSATLASFLKWGTQNYQADKYMASFWNHGGGSVAGAEVDQLFNDDTLSLKEIGQAFEECGTQFEVIGYDTCLMATLENAVTLAPYAKYLVASEEYEPGGGWQYTDWLTYLVENPSCSGEALGKSICDSYYAKCENNGNENMATLAVIDLSKIGNIQTAFDDMAKEMSSISSEITQFQQLYKGVSKAENYGGNTEEEGYTNMVDLVDIVKNTQSILPNTANSVVSAVNDAVLYNVKGENRSNANGLSVFFPLSASSAECDQYAQVSVSNSYLRFIDAIMQNWDAPSEIYQNETKVETVKQEDHTISLETDINDDGIFTLDVTSGLEAVDSVKFNLYYKTDKLILLGTDNDIEGDWDTGSFKDNFRGVWPALNNHLCYMNIIAEEDDYNIYSTPVLLNGRQTNLRTLYDFTKQKFEVMGIYDGVDSDSGMGSRDNVELKNGDVIELLFYVSDNNGQNADWYKMGSIEYDGNLEVTEIPLNNNDTENEYQYLYRYQVTDVFGNTSYSDSVNMICKNGEIIVSNE